MSFSKHLLFISFLGCAINGYTMDPFQKCMALMNKGLKTAHRKGILDKDKTPPAAEAPKVMRMGENHSHEPNAAEKAKEAVQKQRRASQKINKSSTGQTDAFVKPKGSVVKPFSKLANVEFIFDKDIFAYKGLKLLSKNHSEYDQVISPIAYPSLAHLVNKLFKRRKVTFIVATDFDQKNIQNYFELFHPTLEVSVVEKSRVIGSKLHPDIVALTPFEDTNDISRLLGRLNDQLSTDFNFNFLLTTRIDDVDTSEDLIYDIKDLNIVPTQFRDFAFEERKGMSILKRLRKHLEISKKNEVYFKQVHRFVEQNNIIPPTKVYDHHIMVDIKPVTLNSAFRNYIFDGDVWSQIDLFKSPSIAEKYPNMDYKRFSLFAETVLNYYFQTGKLPLSKKTVLEANAFSDFGKNLGLREIKVFLKQSENLTTLLDLIGLKELKELRTSLNTKTK